MSKFSECLNQILILSKLLVIVRQGTIFSANLHLQNSAHRTRTTHLSGGMKGSLQNQGMEKWP